MKENLDELIGQARQNITEYNTLLDDVSDEITENKTDSLMDHVEKKENEPEQKEKNMAVVNKNLMKVEYVEEVKADYSNEEKRKAAIKEAYKASGRAGDPNKLNDRQKKMQTKLAQQEKIAEYKPIIKEDVPIVERRANAKMSNPQIAEYVVEYMRNLKAIKIGSNEDLANNYGTIMDTLDSIEELKDHVWNCAYNKKLSNDTEKDARILFASADRLREYVDAQKELMQNKYYALLAQEDTKDFSDEQIEEKAKNCEKINPELARYYRSFIKARNKTPESKKVGMIIEGARKSFSEDDENWQNWLSEGRIKRRGYDAQNINSKMRERKSNV